MIVPEKPGDPAVAIAATFTTDPLISLLRLILDEAGLDLHVLLAPYNQVFQELLTSTSLLATNADGVDVVLLRVEDFVREVATDEEARAIITQTTTELAGALTGHIEHAKVPTVLAVMPPSTRVASPLISEILAANAALVKHARSLPLITLISSDELGLESGEEGYDSLGDEIAHMPFSEEHYAAIALGIARKVHALRVPAHKVLVLDCDQTLWRGVVGEDGVNGLTVSPGLARVQEFAVKIQADGALVCLVSKNAERDVLDVFERRSDMPLRLEHIVSHRINWEPKPGNVASLARALNLGLDSFVFIDDNPLECAQMRAELPQVVTLQLPPEGKIESFLTHLWAFDKLTVTQEDTRRTSLYRENAARREFEESSTDIAKFIASLGIVIEIAPPEESEWARVAQLTQRTNQFNFTTVRRTEAEVRALPRSGFTVLRVKVRDRFGDYGLVGLIITEISSDILRVDTFLLSCRVLGRGVEHAMVRRLGELAKRKELRQICLEYLPTPKNEPARAFAESVAAKFRFRTEEPNRIVYRIPVENASALVHQPGHDPAAVIEARQSEEKNGATPGMLVLSITPSERYAKLAQELVSGRAVIHATRAREIRSRALPGKPAMPASVTERRMIVLWQELLPIEGLGVEDDYFALGGTSVIAARLIAEIARRFGVRLPLTCILESPTVRALSRRLEQERNHRPESLVELRRGGARNLFLVHDGDGETLLYLNLARRMPDDLAVFGIEPRRLRGVPLAHASIEDMAASYVEQVRKRQPHGPYLFAGMCAGGVIAYEMASQLVHAGENVDLLALLDSAKPKAQKKAWRVAEQRLGRMKQVFAVVQNRELSLLERVRAIGAVVRKLGNALLWEISHRIKRWSVRVRFRLLQGLLTRELGWPKFAPALTVREIYDTAEALYTPKLLSIPFIVLLRGLEGEGNDTPYRHIYADEAFGWRAVAPGLTVVDVSGGHSSMLQEGFVDSLAKALMPFVQQESKPLQVILGSNDEPLSLTCSQQRLNA
jgi:FkbH-like protein